jgi:hypothetical protein
MFLLPVNYSHPQWRLWLLAACLQVGQHFIDERN